MKQIMLKIVTSIATLMLVIPPLISFTFAQDFTPHDLQTRIVLDNSLKPEYSPGVVIDPETLKAEGAETAFANYLLQLIAGGLITIAAPVAIIVIAISGLFAVVSHGDQKLIDKAKKTLTFAMVGLLVIIFSWVIVRTTIEIVLTVNNSPTNQNSGGNTSTTPNGGSSVNDSAPVKAP